MLESINLWENIVNSRFLQYTKFVLFLNKYDQLPKMLSIASPSSLFPDYKVKKVRKKNNRKIN